MNTPHTYLVEQRQEGVCSMGVVQDGLVLWLDAKAQRQLMKDGQSKSIWKDLSGNGNDGQLMNFDFTEDSGWVDGGLKFDGVNDYIQLPANIITDRTNFTIQKNDQILVIDGYEQRYIDEGKVKTVGRNLVQNTSDGIIISPRNTGNAADNYNYAIITAPLKKDVEYTLSFDVEITNGSFDTVSIYSQYGYSSLRHVPLVGGRVVFNFTATENTEEPITFIYAGKAGVTRGNGAVLWNLKIEKGSTATPWTPAPEDLILDRVDEKILYDYTGRNLIIGSKVQSGFANTNSGLPLSYRNGITTEFIKVSPGIYIVSYASMDNSRNIILHFDTKKNKIYTWTWSKETHRLLNINSTGYLVISVIDDSVPLDSPDSKTKEEYMKLYLPKLEKGSIATPWTPAPEDIRLVNEFRFYNRALTDEEILQNYRATHFLLEPKTFTSNDYYNYYDLNRVEINTLATKDLAEVLRGDISLESINFDRDMKSIPFADVLNKVEGNINILGNKLYKPKGWVQPKLDWRYNQPFSYEDANRLERNLLLLYNYAKGNIDKIPYCGAYTCGEVVV